MFTKCLCCQEYFEARFARVASAEASTSALLKAGSSAKDESSDESSSEDDDAVQREKQLAALQLQVLDSTLSLILTRCPL